MMPPPKRGHVRRRSPPLTWSIHAGRGAHAESIGDLQTAVDAYARALTINPDVQLAAFWDVTPLRQQARATAAPLTIWGVTVQALSQGQAVPISADDPLPPMRLGIETAIRGWIALGAGDRERADIALQRAQRAPIGDEEAIWMLILTAEIARVDGRDAQARDLTAQARALRDAGDLNADWAEGANIFYMQSLRLAIPRIFLPQAHIDMMLTGTLIDYALAQMP